ncbi:MAG: hypothetical protein ACQEVA_06645 [Myxococcota bacterium]
MLVAPSFLQVFIDEVLIAGHEDWAFWLVAGLAGLAVLGWLTVRLSLRVRRRWLVATKSVLYERGLDWLFGHAGARAASGAGQVAALDRLLDQAEALPESQLDALIDGCTLSLLILLLALYSLPLAALVVVLFFAVGVFEQIRFGLSIEDDVREAAAETARQFALYTEGSDHAMPLVGRMRARRWAHARAAEDALVQQYESYEHTTASVRVFVAGALHAVSLGAGGWLVMDGALSLGALIAFQAILALALERAASLNGNLLSIRNCIEDLSEDIPVRVLAGNSSTHDDAPNIQQGDTNHIEFIDFASSRDDGHIHLTVPASTAIVLEANVGLGAEIFAREACGELATNGIVRHGGETAPKLVLVSPGDAMLEQTVGEALDPNASTDEASLARQLVDVGVAADGDEAALALVNRPPSSLSESQRCKLSIARAANQNADIVFVERVADRLSPADIESTRRHLTARGQSVVFITDRPSQYPADLSRIRFDDCVRTEGAEEDTASSEEEA